MGLRLKWPGLAVVTARRLLFRVSAGSRAKPGLSGVTCTSAGRSRIRALRRKLPQIPEQHQQIRKVRPRCPGCFKIDRLEGGTNHTRIEPGDLHGQPRLVSGRC